MKYYRIITHHLKYNSSYTMVFNHLEKYESEDNLITDIKKCLENDDIAYVQYQEVTYNIFSHSSTKSPNDYSFGTMKQKLYTKLDRFSYETDYLTSYIVT